jgi:hypothetical protein
MTDREKTAPPQDRPPGAGWQSPTPLDVQKAYWEQLNTHLKVVSLPASDIKPESRPEKPEAKSVSDTKEPIRDAKGRISRRQFLRLGAVIAGTATAVALTPERVLSQENENQNSHEKMFVSGTVQIFTEEGVGSAYLVRHDHSYGLYTIEHVVAGRGVATIKITLPDAVMRIPNVPLSDFVRLGAPNGAADRSAVLEIDGNAAVTLDSYWLGGLQRERLPRELKVGSLLGSPRLDTKAWTVYRVTEFAGGDNLIKVEAVNGNQCEGRSGSPMILMNDNKSILIRRDTGNGVVVGEVEGPWEGTAETPDIVGTGFSCAQYIRVNIAQV